MAVEKEGRFHTNPVRRESFAHGYSARVNQDFTRKTAAECAAFFIPHLRLGMSLLDCGCGPGTITVGLAEAIALGQVVGVDIEENQVQPTRQLASDRGVSNLRFETGDIFNLPYADASFDAVFLHAVLTHVSDPLKALGEVRRVLAPGGMLGVRHAPREWIIEPHNALLEESMRGYDRMWVHKGGHPNMGRQQKALLRKAGFRRIEASASFEYYGTPEAIRSIAEGMMIPVWREAADELIAVAWKD